jgi:hypothetical protein
MDCGSLKLVDSVDYSVSAFKNVILSLTVCEVEILTQLGHMLVHSHLV